MPTVELTAQAAQQLDYGPMGVASKGEVGFDGSRVRLEGVHVLLGPIVLQGQLVGSTLVVNNSQYVRAE